MSKKRYSVIYADPPWWYNNRKTGGERKNKTRFGGGAMKHYPLMRDRELLDMRSAINELAADNCVLFLWATGARFDFAIDLIRAWDFRFCTVAFVWVKTDKTMKLPIFNPGYYTASNAEFVLLACRGSMRPETPMLNQIILAPHSGHSRKPDMVRHRIELMYPNLNRIELFARPIDSMFQPFAGWDVFGNEVESDIELATA